MRTFILPGFSTDRVSAPTGPGYDVPLVLPSRRLGEAVTKTCVYSETLSYGTEAKIYRAMITLRELYS